MRHTSVRIRGLRQPAKWCASSCPGAKNRRGEAPAKRWKSRTMCALVEVAARAAALASVGVRPISCQDVMDARRLGPAHLR
jgi:hypothetical protein